MLFMGLAQKMLLMQRELEALRVMPTFEGFKNVQTL